MNCLYLHCRPGFEKECAAEITEQATVYGIYGYSKTTQGAAWVTYVCQSDDGAKSLMEKLAFSSLIFIRQWFVAGAVLYNLPVDDRLTALLAAAKELPASRELIVETIDTNTGKALSVLGKKFSSPFVQALKKSQCFDSKSPWRMHLVFLSGTSAVVGVSLYRNSSAWPMGIPRLRLPRAAPSRATLKLEEAWHYFIPKDEWASRLAPSMTAVDLGAAPGGWTWQLVQRGMFVTAVDNGPMAQELMDTGQVRHVREDGFYFLPKKQVHWLVCDIVDKPARVANLITQWGLNAYCREAIFNLKLPMKQRYAEVKKLQARMQEQLDEAGVAATIQFKQLYHDREEVTGHLRLGG